MDFERLFGSAIAELDRLLSAKTVVGEPTTVDGNTLIPLVSVGFGFGGGGGEGQPQGPGNGAGLGGGGGVRPVALVVVGKDGVRLERIEPPKNSALEAFAMGMGQLARREGEKRGLKPPEEEGAARG